MYVLYIEFMEENCCGLEKNWIIVESKDRKQLNAGTYIAHMPL